MKIFFKLTPVFLIFFITCQHDQHNSPVNNMDQLLEQQTLVPGDSLNHNNADNAYYYFPSPGEILKIINKENLVFNKKLLLPIKDVKEINDDKTVILHLGRQIAELTYIALFNQHDLSVTYLSKVYELSEMAGIKVKELKKSNIKRLTSNHHLKDSLLAISNSAFYLIIDKLEKDNRQDGVAIFSIGAFIECLYLATHLVDQYSTDNQVVLKIWEQDAALTNLLSYAEENKKISREEYYAINEIKQIKHIFDNFREKDTDQLNTSEISHVTLSESEYNDLKEKISQIRNKLIR